jgi:hypothetical protein
VDTAGFTPPPPATVLYCTASVARSKQAVIFHVREVVTRGGGGGPWAGGSSSTSSFDCLSLPSRWRRSAEETNDDDAISSSLGLGGHRAEAKQSGRVAGKRRERLRRTLGRHHAPEGAVHSLTTTPGVRSQDSACACVQPHVHMARPCEPTRQVGWRRTVVGTGHGRVAAAVRTRRAARSRSAAS